MFQLYPGALDSELERRHEVAVAMMRAAHGLIAARGRVPGVARFRDVAATLALAVLVAAS